MVRSSVEAWRGGVFYGLHPATCGRVTSVGPGGLEPPPHPYQLNSGCWLTKFYEANESARAWVRPAGRGPVVVIWCCRAGVVAWRPRVAVRVRGKRPDRA